ncbi:type II toxin-antitoxin system Phd/YefM family antitoxin [Rugamonas apoptosis]|nr:type II toxin-antitoxin system Phd/YefM family antitoxin [Rugamonas apoptosis]
MTTSAPLHYWQLHDAKAHFCELVRRVHREGPQRVIVHSQGEVVVIAAEDYRRLRGVRMGSALIEAIQASPYRNAKLEAPGHLCLSGM